MSESERVSLDSLPTLGEMRSRPMPQPKGPTKLERQMSEAPEDRKAEERFKANVRKRDKMICRCCKRTVIATMKVQRDRAEVHHIYGRLGDFRYAEEHAILLCMYDHQRATGKIGGAKLFVLQKASSMLKVGEKWLIDARKAVRFEEAA